jgi:hypothetical protein
MGVGVVRGENSVGVPLRRLFRYEWMDVSLVIASIHVVEEMPGNEEDWEFERVTVINPSQCMEET